ncbi:6-bladed beta-propeller [Belliella pelovolcani]|uniref:6-bladed beta-propeller protein n=1 Tax=Belliella pelovolcani TaxID=529505 RepID=A0A1N7PWE5_9BACT|nr:6-bladed beta-propeller [Belliella pelovolcani]SIT14983.1 6-bladed beta-propeller protein [Belliella pelovolcani]
MGKLKLFGFASFLVFFFDACTVHETKSEIPTLSIDLDQVRKGKASDYFESVDYLWFEDESSEDASIGVFHRVIKHKGRFYIFDEDICICFYIFSEDGKFIKKIKGYGEGPGEYMSPSVFLIQNDTILLNDISQKKILSYDLDGNWLEDGEQRLPANEVHLDSKGNEYYFSRSYMLNNTKNQVRVFDKHGHLKFVGFPYKDEFLGLNVVNRKPFVELSGGVVLVDDYIDTLYIIDQYVEKPFLAFDFKDKGYKSKDLERLKDLDVMEQLEFLNKKTPLYFDGRAVLSERFFIGSFRFQEKSVIGVYDFENHVSSTFDFGVINDLDQGKVIYGLSPLDQESVYSWTTGIDLYKHVESLKRTMSKEEWQKYVKGEGSNLVNTAIRAKESENRVLIIFKWK